jgi:PKD repeat protein/predicted RNA-binding protein with TRAM domain
MLSVGLIPTTVPTVRADTRVGALTLNTGENVLSSAVIDSGGGFAYFGTETSPGRVVKVRLSDFTRVGGLTLNTGENLLSIAVIDAAGGFAYFGTDTSPGRVVKVRLSDFTRVGALTLNTGENLVSSAVIDSAGGFAYFGTDTSPGRVVKVRLSDFTRVGALTLSTGENALGSAVIDAVNGFAYFGTDTSPGRVVKVRLSDLTRIGALTLNTGENLLSSADIDVAGGFAYFGTDTSPGRVVKVRLSDFTRVGSLTLNTGENHLGASVMDTVNGYLYYGTDLTSPGRVVKVRLSDFTRVGSLTLNTGENDLGSAVMDDVGYAYFGTATSPGRVVKVDLFDFALSNSGGVTVFQGASGSNTITLALVSGGPREVALSCTSGLPPGASCSFNPASGLPTYSSTLTISASFSTPTGDFAVTVTATGGGLTRTTQFTLSVAPKQPPTAVISAPGKDFVKASVLYDASGSFDNNVPPQPIANYTWTDGAGDFLGNQPTVTRTFTSPGSYVTNLRVCNSGLCDSEAHTILINPVKNIPTAVVAAPTMAFVKQTIVFDGTGSFDNSNPTQNIVSYSWTVTDAAGNVVVTGIGSTLIVAFSLPGFYTASLTVCNESGLCGSANHEITILPVDADATGDGVVNQDDLDLIGSLMGVVVDCRGVQPLTCHADIDDNQSLDNVDLEIARNLVGSAIPIPDPDADGDSDVDIDDLIIVYLNQFTTVTPGTIQAHYDVDQDLDIDIDDLIGVFLRQFTPWPTTATLMQERSDSIGEEAETGPIASSQAAARPEGPQILQVPPASTEAFPFLSVAITATAAYNVTLRIFGKGRSRHATVHARLQPSSQCR